MTEVVFGIIIVLLILWHFLDRRERESLHNEAIAQAREDYLKAEHEQAINDESTIDHLEEIIKNLSKERQGDKENTAKLINALISKTAREAQELGMTDRIGVFKHNQQQDEEKDPDLIPVEQLPQDEWEKHVLGETQEEVKK